MRLHRPWKVPIHIPRVDTGSIAEMRVSISFAALLVKVTASTPAGLTLPVWISQAMRVVSTRVFPDPAPARISACWFGRVTAWSCSGLRLSRRLGIRDCGHAAAILPAAPRGELQIGVRRLPRDAWRRDAVFAVERAGERFGPGLRRQARDADVVGAPALHAARLELRGVAGGADLLVHAEDGVLRLTRSEHDFPPAAAAGRALPVGDLGLRRPLLELLGVDRGDGL